MRSKEAVEVSWDFWLLLRIPVHLVNINTLSPFPSLKMSFGGLLTRRIHRIIYPSKFLHRTLYQVLHLILLQDIDGLLQNLDVEPFASVFASAHQHFGRFFQPIAVNVCDDDLLAALAGEGDGGCLADAFETVSSIDLRLPGVLGSATYQSRRLLSRLRLGKETSGFENSKTWSMILLLTV